MTRINCIPPAELTGPHLLAEYRELPRIFALVRAAIARGETPTDKRNPEHYTLGKGHVRFFYPRLKFLVKRQEALVAEMQKRGYAPTFTNMKELALDMPDEWCGDWQPTAEAIALNRERIALRIRETALRRKQTGASGSPSSGIKDG